MTTIPLQVLNQSTPLYRELDPPTLIHPQCSLIDQGLSRADWIEWLLNESPERAYLQGLIYLDKAFGWTKQMMLSLWEWK